MLYVDEFYESQAFERNAVFFRYLSMLKQLVSIQLIHTLGLEHMQESHLYHTHLGEMEQE